jgi:hypothetical protein
VTALAVDADGDAQVLAAVRFSGLEGGGGADAGLVFAATAEIAVWSEAEDRLAAAFAATKEAAAATAPIVYLLREEDLSGTRGALSAAVACALLSCARTLAMEGAKREQAANVIAFGPGTAAERIASTLRWLLEDRAPRGQLLDLGSTHFGRARP